MLEASLALSEDSGTRIVDVKNLLFVLGLEPTQRGPIDVRSQSEIDGAMRLMAAGLAVGLGPILGGDRSALRQIEDFVEAVDPGGIR